MVRDAAAGPEVLLTRNSARGPHPRLVERSPAAASTTARRPGRRLVREVREETGTDCTLARCVIVGTTHFEGTAPSGRGEDCHSSAGRLRRHGPPDANPRVVQEVDGTTDRAAWVPLADVESGDDRPVYDTVRAALAS